MRRGFSPLLAACGFISSALLPSPVKATLAALTGFVIWVIAKQTEDRAEGLIGASGGFVAFAITAPLSTFLSEQSQWIVDYFYVFLATMLGFVLGKLISQNYSDDDNGGELE